MDAPAHLLWDRYVALAAGPKTVLRLKSLAMQPVSKSAFTDCLTRSALRTSEGKAWAYHHVSAAFSQLADNGLLTRELACVPALLHPVACDAIASSDGEAMVAAVRKGFPVWSQAIYTGYRHVDGAAEMLVRLAIYANDAESFVAKRQLLDAQPAGYRAADALTRLCAGGESDRDWLLSRHPTIQVALLESRLLTLMTTGAADSGLGALVEHYAGQALSDGFAGLPASLAQHAIMAGRLSDAADHVTALPDGPVRLALQGQIDFLAGRNAACLEAFRAALRLHRKQVGKRKIFLDGVAGPLFLLALLRANDAGFVGEIQAALDIVIPQQVRYVAGFSAVQAMLWSIQGADGKARALLADAGRLPRLEPLSLACLALADFVADAEMPAPRQATLAQAFEAYRERLPLVARVLAEVLAETATDPQLVARCRAFLAAPSDINLAFTDIVRRRPSWERALQSLDQFLGGMPAPDAVPLRKEKRLVWFIDPITQFVDVAEQTAKGRDGWSDGRPVSLKRLHARDPRLNYLTEQDLAALRGIKIGGWGGDFYEIDARKTIPALVGHPAVFDADMRSRRLELVAYPLELVVSERAEGFHVALSHSAERAYVFLEAETPTRYRVIEFPAKMLALQEILGSGGLTVPATARDRLVALVRRDNPTLPIRSELVDAGHVVLEGDPAPVAQCVPHEAGVRLALVVRPLGPDGPAFMAGMGGRSVLATVGGERRRANRDLAHEIAARDALVAACPTLRDRGGADLHEVVIDDLEGALELLLELQSYAGPLAVEWPEGQRLRVSAVVAGKVKLRVGQERDWFSVDGSVAIDDEQVLEMRFLLDRLSRAQGRFVPLEDGRFIALTRQLQAQLQRLNAVSEPGKTGRRVHALGAAALEGVLEEAGEVSADKAWKQHIARIRKAEGFVPALPPQLQAELRDYQFEGFAWMSRLARWGAGACLADDMGLGKTVQAIAVLLERGADGPCLVVAPTSVGPNWEAEIARFAPSLVTHRFAAATDRAAMVAAMGPRDVLVCSYGLLHQAAELMGEKAWHTVVLDEAQAIKNATTKRAQASLALQAGFRIALTGTPVENDLDELWSLFSFVNPGLLGTRDGFQKRFAVPIERDRDPQARQALRALIRPFLLRRTKAAVLSELPPRIEQTMQVEQSEPERVFYEALRRRAVEAISLMDAQKGQRRIQILAEIMRLRRACCNPALIDPEAGVPSGKLAAFLELVDDLIRNRHQALVFSQFVGHLKLVREALERRGIRYEYLDGSTPSAERERAVAAFQAGSADLFLISLRAGGTGLNLTAADYVVHLDPWWNPAVEDQASDRVHRIGQERPVTIYRLVMRDSIEERILQLHRDKRDLASELLEGGEAAGRLSEEELLELIRG